MAGPAGRLIALAAAALGAVAAAGPASPVIGLAGHYVDRSTDPLAGTPLVSTLDILPLDREHAYVDAALFFPNGFNCGLSAVMQAERDRLSYVEPGGERCRVTIRHVGRNVVISDGEGDDCRSHCGMNAEMEGEFAATSRRAIADPAQLRRSADYRSAITAWRRATAR